MPLTTAPFQKHRTYQLSGVKGTYCRVDIGNCAEVYAFRPKGSDTIHITAGVSAKSWYAHRLEGLTFDRASKTKSYVSCIRDLNQDWSLSPKPFIDIEVIGRAETRKRANTDGWWPEDPVDTYRASTYFIRGNEHYKFSSVSPYGTTTENCKPLPFMYVPVRITSKESGEELEATLCFYLPMAGRFDVSKVEPFTPYDSRLGRYQPKIWKIPFEGNFFGQEHQDFHSIKDEQDLLWLMNCVEAPQQIRTLWEMWFSQKGLSEDSTYESVELASVKSMWTRKAHRAPLSKLRTEENFLYRFLLYLHSKKTFKGTTNNKLIAAFLGLYASDYEALRKSLQDLADSAHEIHSNGKVYRDDEHGPFTRALCLKLPGAGERERKRKEKKQWQHREGLSEKAEGLGVDAARHKKLFKAILEGRIPLRIFHAPGNPNQIVNEDFDLWEESLKQKGWEDVICKISQDASLRVKYPKPITSYLSFLLYTLPTYLNRVAKLPGRKKWKCMPTFVESSWQLEMDEPDEEGTVKTRSALTPVADNDTGIVTVPYVSMALHGNHSTYCYSGQYYVAERGLNDPLGDGVFSKDYESKLNGRDDYGLMFYTLMGSDRNSGYPTFLVILERRSKQVGVPSRECPSCFPDKHGVTDNRYDIPHPDCGYHNPKPARTWVHFHRVRPCRSKNKLKTPTSHLIKACYQYMAGNVSADEIEAQQGDLIFIRRDKLGKAAEPSKGITAFEGHHFQSKVEGSPIKLARSIAKSPTNRLGYLVADAPFSVQHQEHDDIPHLDAGIWEVRRCKSWEANPTAVWSYTID